MQTHKHATYKPIDIALHCQVVNGIFLLDQVIVMKVCKKSTKRTHNVHTSSQRIFRGTSATFCFSLNVCLLAAAAGGGGGAGGPVVVFVLDPDMKDEENPHKDFGEILFEMTKISTQIFRPAVTRFLECAA